VRIDWLNHAKEGIAYTRARSNTFQHKQKSGSIQEDSGKDYVPEISSSVVFFNKNEVEISDS